MPDGNECPREPGGASASLPEAPAAAASPLAWSPASSESDIFPAGAAPLSGPKRFGLGARLSLAAVAAVVLAGAGAGASVALSGSTKNGAATPAAAVTAMLGALGDGDFLAVLDDLAPGERNALEPGLESIFSQLKRLDVLSSDANLANISGISVHFSGLQTVTDQLTPEVAAVRVTGGTATSTVDPSQLPLSAWLQSLVGIATSGKATTRTSPAGGPGSGVVGTVEVGGSWYVSIGYSIALNALAGSPQGEAPPATSLQAAGASSPEGAVQAIFTSLSNLDLSALLADLPPDEMAALYAYAPDWLPKAQAALNSVKGKVSTSFGNLSFSTKALGQGALVEVNPGLTFSVVASGASITYANGCATENVLGSLRKVCQGANNPYLSKLLSALPPPVSAIVKRLSSAHPETGFVTVEEGGRWFVSPTRTALQAVVAVMQELKSSDLHTIVDNAPAVRQALKNYARQLGSPFGSLVPRTPG
jgi:hypothetical protein